MVRRFHRQFRSHWAQHNEERSHHPRFHEHQGHHGHHRGWHRFNPEQLALRSTAAEVIRLFAIASRSSFEDAEKQARLRTFLERSRKELSDIIYGTGKSTGEAPVSNIEQV